MTFLDSHGQPDPSFNAKRRVERDLAEMLGLAKGVIADGVVTEEEAMALRSWVDDHPDVLQGWPGNILHRRLREIFADGYASDEEREDLGELLSRLIGGEGVMIGGETAASTLPLDDPLPGIEIPDRVFVFTGRFAFGCRGKCEEAVRRIGGWVEPRVTQRANYLVIGTFGSRDWSQTSFGREIENAVELREKHDLPLIIPEQHWVAHL